MSETYLLIVYRPSWEEYSRSCLMDRGSEELDILNQLDADGLTERLGSILYCNYKSKRNAKITIFRDQIKIYDNGLDWDFWEDEEYIIECKKQEFHYDLSVIIINAKKLCDKKIEESKEIEARRKKSMEELKLEREKEERFQKYQELKKEFDNDYTNL